MPPYKELEIMTQRIKYSIENCGDIDADFNARPEGDEEGGSEEEWFKIIDDGNSYQWINLIKINLIYLETINSKNQ